MMEQPFDLVIDEGNTRTKMALFRDGRRHRSAAMPNADIGALHDLLNGRPVRDIVIGSVAAAEAAFREELATIAPVLEVGGDTPLPIGMGYTTPATLGADRVANAVGARDLFTDRPVLVIDAGTCITYDLVEADGTFTGGAISPGMSMRARAMHSFSARLPEVEPMPVPLIGGSTRSALTSGVFNGAVHEMLGMIDAFRHERPGLAVILTGGDALTFTRALKSGIFAHPFLTLDGLYAILLHNRAHHGIAGPAGPNGPEGAGSAG